MNIKDRLKFLKEFKNDHFDIGNRLGPEALEFGRVVTESLIEVFEHLEGTGEDNVDKESIDKRILDKFYKQIPDGVTTEDLAKGTHIVFKYGLVEHVIDTRADYKYVTKSIGHYYEYLERKVIETVRRRYK